MFPRASPIHDEKEKRGGWENEFKGPEVTGTTATTTTTPNDDNGCKNRRIRSLGTE